MVGRSVISYDPGVVPAHQQLQIYHALVLAGMQGLREHGQAAVVLESFSDPEQAIASYHALGFTTRRRLIAYQATVPSAHNPED